MELVMRADDSGETGDKAESLTALTLLPGLAPRATGLQTQKLTEGSSTGG